MAKYIRAVRLRSGDLVSIDAIVAVKRFDAGVGLLDLRNRMIGWIDIDDENIAEDARNAQFRQTLDIFDELINDRRRAQQPDWGYLDPPAKSPGGGKSGGAATASSAGK